MGFVGIVMMEKTYPVCGQTCERAPGPLSLSRQAWPLGAGAGWSAATGSSSWWSPFLRPYSHTHTLTTPAPAPPLTSQRAEHPQPSPCHTRGRRHFSAVVARLQHPHSKLSLDCGIVVVRGGEGEVRPGMRSDVDWQCHVRPPLYTEPRGSTASGGGVEDRRSRVVPPSGSLGNIRGINRYI